MVLALALCLAATPPAHADVSGPAKVIDGDTIAIGDERIRLIGIDAPEKAQHCLSANNDWPCGQRSRQALEAFAADQVLDCKGQKRDRYGRLLAVCFVKGDDINARMVRDGWALAYRRYSTVYVAEEDIARENRTGLWQGEFDDPWDWRRGVRSASTR